MAPCSSHKPASWQRGPKWQATSFQHNQLPKHLSAWLLDQGSLTQKLVERSQGRLRVKVLQQRIQAARLSEYKALAQPVHSKRSSAKPTSKPIAFNTRRWAVVREVVLYGNDVPWVYARTIIPLLTLKGSLRRLHYLGNKPLGGALFADPSMRRQGLELAEITTQDLPPNAQSLHASKGSIWGRRSLFFLKNKPLLVCEVFLEKLIK
ncbi:MAG: chorismate--pyruvate lyase family protein [Cellvibrionaceae bacterium]